MSKLKAKGIVLHWILLLAVLTSLFIKAFFQFNENGGGDYLWYHLPNGLLHWGYTNFTPSPYIQLISNSFPPLADWVEGFLVWMTGSVKAATGANFLALMLSFFVIHILYKKSISMRWFITSVFSIPLVMLYSSSGYVDLFGACGILIAFASLGKISRSEVFPLASSFFILGILIATLSRFQTWPAAALLCFIALVKLWGFSPELSKKQIIFCLLASFMAFGIWPLRNFVKYGNPTYPYAAPVIGKYFPSAISMEELYVNQVPLNLQGKSQPLVFMNSLFELSRFEKHSYKFHWSVDQGTQDGKVSPHFRMGGWSIYTVCIFLLFLALGLFRKIFAFLDVAFLGVILIFTSFMSQGHELRYFMFIPMCTAFLIVRALPSYSMKMQNLYCLLILAAAIHVGDRSRLKNFDFSGVEDKAPEKAKAAWKAYDLAEVKKPLCGVDGPDSIYFTGPNFKEYPVVDNDKENCKGIFYDPPSKK